MTFFNVALTILQRRTLQFIEAANPLDAVRQAKNLLALASIPGTPTTFQIGVDAVTKSPPRPPLPDTPPLRPEDSSFEEDTELGDLLWGENYAREHSV